MKRSFGQQSMRTVWQLLLAGAHIPLHILVQFLLNFSKFRWNGVTSSMPLEEALSTAFAVCFTGADMITQVLALNEWVVAAS